MNKRLQKLIDESNARAAGDRARLRSKLPPAGRAALDRSPKPKTGRSERDHQVAIVERSRAEGALFASSLNGIATRNGLGKERAIEEGLEAGEPDLRYYGHPLRPGNERLVRLAGLLNGLIAESPPSEPGALLEHLEVASLIAWLEVGAPGGMVVELKLPSAKPKTDRAMRFSGAKPHQRERLARLEEAGFIAEVGYGEEDAIEKLERAGYLQATR